MDAVVTSGLAGAGLAAGVAVLINAPGADLAALMRQVRASSGPAARCEPGAGGRPVTSLPGRRRRAGRAPGQLAGPVPGVGGAVLPGAVLDGAGRHRRDRERRRGRRGAVVGRGARADAVHAVDLADLGYRRVRPDRAAGHHEPAGRGALGGPDAVRGRRGLAAARHCLRPSSPTTTRTGTSARCSRWPASTRRSTREDGRGWYDAPTGRDGCWPRPGRHGCGGLGAGRLSGSRARRRRRPAVRAADGRLARRLPRRPRRRLSCA